MDHRYSTAVLIILAGVIIIAAITTSIESQDIDEVCNMPGTFLYRNSTGWTCAIIVAGNSSSGGTGNITSNGNTSEIPYYVTPTSIESKKEFYTNFTGNNRKVYLSKYIIEAINAPTSGLAYGYTTGSGYTDGNCNYYYIFAYTTINSVRRYSEVPLNLVDDCFDAGGLHTVNVTWNSVSGAEGYILYHYSDDFTESGAPQYKDMGTSLYFEDANNAGLWTSGTPDVSNTTVYAIVELNVQGSVNVENLTAIGKTNLQSVIATAINATSGIIGTITTGMLTITQGLTIQSGTTTITPTAWNVSIGGNTILKIGSTYIQFGNGGSGDVSGGVTLGPQAVLRGNNGVCIGYQSNCSATGSQDSVTGIGAQASALARGCTAIGQSSYCNELSSVAIGTGHVLINGTNGLAFPGGVVNKLGGFAYGYNTFANQENASVWGTGNTTTNLTATTPNSLTIGWGAKTEIQISKTGVNITGNLTMGNLILPSTKMVNPITGATFFNATVGVPCYYNGTAWTQANRSTGC